MLAFPSPPAAGAAAAGSAPGAGAGSTATGTIGSVAPAGAGAAFHSFITVGGGTLNLIGNFDADPDPLRRDNIMLSAYILNCLNLYEAVTGDRRYDEPGALTFVWTDGRTFPYDHHSVADAVVVCAFAKDEYVVATASAA